MLYSEVRDQIKSGDVITFRGQGPICAGIRWWDKSEAAHVATAWAVGGRVLLLESRTAHKGVTIHRELSTALADGATWRQTPEVWTEAHLARALSMLGVKYGLVDALRAGLGLRATSQGMQCAEYAAFIKGLDPRAPYTPGTFVELYPNGVRLT